MGGDSDKVLNEALMYMCVYVCVHMCACLYVSV